MRVIPQILGNSPEDFIAMGNVLYDLGYRCINWNLGCPFPQVAKKFKGSGLLPHPDRVDAFLERVLSASPSGSPSRPVWADSVSTRSTG